MFDFYRSATMLVLFAVTAAAADTQLKQPTAADAQPAASVAPKPPTRVRLTPTPAAEPLPALKYRLLPSFYEERRGNAAPLYAKAMLQLGRADEADSRRQKLLEGPLSECTPEAVDPLAADSILSTIRLAVVREHCDWELPVHEQNFIAILLPEIQELRRLAQIVALDGRGHLAARRYGEAVKSLETLYAMARHTAEGPTVIHSLVGLNIQGMADKLVLELAQQPESPNLYWALTVLPQPLIDRRRALASEMHLLDFTWTAWNRMPEVIPGDAEIHAFLDNYSTMVLLAGTETQPPDKVSKSAAVALMLLRVAARRDEVRAYLERQGVAKVRLDSLSDVQLAVLHMRFKYDEIRDDSFRWMQLPYPQAKVGLDAATERLKRAVATQEEILPCATILLPAIFSMRLTHARAERRMDVLRLIEAVRGYAARHGGRLPATLDELAATPVAIDAVSGKPLDYRIDAEGATLTLPDEFNGPNNALVYEIRTPKAEGASSERGKK